MVFSLIIIALAVSLGHVTAAPFGARDLCQGSWCARFVPKDGHPDIYRRLAQFDGYSVSLSSSPFGEPTPTVNPSDTPANPSSTTSSFNFFSPPANPSSTTSSSDLFSPPANPSSTVSSSDLFSIPTPTPSSSISRSSFDPFLIPSPTPSGSSSSLTPPGGGPVTITVTSTVFLNPTQSPPVPDSGLFSTSPANSDSTSPPTPSSTVPDSVASLNPTLSEPNGELSSFSSSSPAPSPTVVLLTDGTPDSTTPPDPADQPTPTPTTGIIFLPPGASW